MRLNREALKLLRALAGNDTVKNRIVQEGGATLLKELLQIHIVRKKRLYYSLKLLQKFSFFC